LSDDLFGSQRFDLRSADVERSAEVFGLCCCDRAARQDAGMAG
jgi:hypothetical protein